MPVAFFLKKAIIGTVINPHNRTLHMPLELSLKLLDPDESDADFLHNLASLLRNRGASPILDNPELRKVADAMTTRPPQQVSIPSPLQSLQQDATKANGEDVAEEVPHTVVERKMVEIPLGFTRPKGKLPFADSPSGQELLGRIAVWQKAQSQIQAQLQPTESSSAHTPQAKELSQPHPTSQPPAMPSVPLETPSVLDGGLTNEAFRAMLTKISTDHARPEGGANPGMAAINKIFFDETWADGTDKKVWANPDLVPLEFRQRMVNEITAAIGG
jgi:hypothetical protein